MISFPEILFRLAVALILGAVVGFEREQKVQETISRVISELHSLPGINAIHAGLRSPDPEIPFRELAICYTHSKDNYSERGSKRPAWPLGVVRGIPAFLLYPAAGGGLSEKALNSYENVLFRYL